MTMADLPDPMTPKEVASILRISKSMAYTLVKLGQIRHLKIGGGNRARVLIYKADLQAWIDANKQGAAKN